MSEIDQLTKDCEALFKKAKRLNSEIKHKEIKADLKELDAAVKKLKERSEELP